MKPRSTPWGFGTIEPSRGRFRVRVRIEGGYRDFDVVDTREEAEELLRGFSVLATKEEIATTGETLRAYGVGWLDQRELGGVRNIKTDRSRWERHVLSAPFADDALRTIGRRDVKAWVAGLCGRAAADQRGKRRISAQTVKHCLTLLRSCLQSAVDDELLGTNPAAKIKSPKVSRDDGWTYLPPDEQRAVLTCAAIPESVRMIAAFAIGACPRQGEQWALELPDLVVTGPHPHVMIRYGGPGHAPTKGKKIRRVPLFGLALAAAKRWVQILPIFCPHNPRNLVFPTARGCHRGKKAPRGWSGYLAAAGLGNPAKRHDGRSIRWHDLRHTGASSLVAGWWGRVWRLEEVRDVLGHTSVTVTERYAHLAPGVLAEAGRLTVAGLPEAAGAVPNLPQNSHTVSVPIVGKASNTGRATEDSNLWPTAPEAVALSS